MLVLSKLTYLLSTPSSCLVLRWLPVPSFFSTGCRSLVEAMCFIRLAFTGVFICYALSLRDSSDSGGSSGGGGGSHCTRPSTLQTGLMTVLAVMSGEYLLIEAREAWRTGLLGWVSEAWNVFDVAQLGLMGTILGLHWTCAVQLEVVRGLSQVLVLVLFWRLVYYAAALGPLGTFVRCDHMRMMAWPLMAGRYNCRPAYGRTDTCDAVICVFGHSRHRPKAGPPAGLNVGHRICP